MYVYILCNNNTIIYDYNKCTYNTMYYNIYCRVTPFYQGIKSAL